MTTDLTGVDLDAPVAFTSEEVTENPTAQPSHGESGEQDNSPTSGGEPDASDQRVPYSRFAEAVRARKEAEQAAAEATARYEQQSQREPRREEEFIAGEIYQGRMDSKWVSLYGDDERSRRAYGYELERQKELREQIRKEALEAVREDRQAESQVLTQNERTIDSRLDDLGAALGRSLNEREEAAILDIVDEYTPKDRNGNYAGDLISMDKAWEIYSLRQHSSSQRASRGRQTPTALTSMRSEGEPTGKTNANQDWNPQDWNSWKKRIPN